MEGIQGVKDVESFFTSDYSKDRIIDRIIVAVSWHVHLIPCPVPEQLQYFVCAIPLTEVQKLNNLMEAG